MSDKRRLTDAEEAAVQFGIAQDPDNPELKEAEFAAMRPAAEALPPELYDNLIKRKPGQRGPQKAPTKQIVTLRLDRAVVEHFKAGGEGWQTRINDTLKMVVRERKAR
jgi:uncharacterized protein (DUF4415 family)